MNVYEKVIENLIPYFQNHNFTSPLSVRRIRHGLEEKVDASNRSMINFFWRILNKLKENGLLIEKNCNKPKEFYYTKKMIDLINLNKKDNSSLFSELVKIIIN